MSKALRIQMYNVQLAKHKLAAHRENMYLNNQAN